MINLLPEGEDHSRLEFPIVYAPTAALKVGWGLLGWRCKCHTDKTKDLPSCLSVGFEYWGVFFFCLLCFFVSSACCGYFVFDLLESPVACEVTVSGCLVC